VYGYEALVRTREPTIPHPGAFFDAAERLGRLADLGQAIRSAVAAAWVGAAPDWRLFVNLHAEDLLDPRLYDPRSPLAAIAESVVLELTERARLESVGDVVERIDQLRDLGFRIAIDDLGAGYSGLSCFTLLSPDLAKIDRSLIQAIEADPRRQKLVRRMIELCHELGVEAVAEGIETDEERDALVALGCDLIQGYLVGRPGLPFVEPDFGRADAGSADADRADSGRADSGRAESSRKPPSSSRS
jgi:EAL domain-containing protein (putative c-di-GMP-specific phosphodiesterase class I)